MGVGSVWPWHRDGGGRGDSHHPGAWGFLSLPESEAAAVEGMTGWKELGPGYPCPSSACSDPGNCLLGPPMDPEEDSDSTAVYVQGLNDNVTLEDLADFFKQCGVVKVRGHQ